MREVRGERVFREVLLFFAGRLMDGARGPKLTKLTNKVVQMSPNSHATTADF